MVRGRRCLRRRLLSCAACAICTIARRPADLTRCNAAWAHRNELTSTGAEPDIITTARAGWRPPIGAMMAREEVATAFSREITLPPWRQAVACAAARRFGALEPSFKAEVAARAQIWNKKLGGWQQPPGSIAEKRGVYERPELKEPAGGAATLPGVGLATRSG